MAHEKVGGGEEDLGPLCGADDAAAVHLEVLHGRGTRGSALALNEMN